MIPLLSDSYFYHLVSMVPSFLKHFNIVGLLGQRWELLYNLLFFPVDIISQVCSQVTTSFWKHFNKYIFLFYASTIIYVKPFP